MSKIIQFTIDGKLCLAEQGTYLVDAARANGIYIPTLCNVEGLKPRGSCRICSVHINGRPMTACTTPVSEGMEIENDVPKLHEMRKIIIELLFIEGNHFCPSCERSGDCELQALAYRYQIPVPRFAFRFEQRSIEASNPKLMKDHNRCILCKRCIRGIKDKDGRSIFAYKKRSQHLEISIDQRLAKNLTDEIAQQAMDICPVGALIRKGIGYKIPIGQRSYDKRPIGSDIELG